MLIFSECLVIASVVSVSDSLVDISLLLVISLLKSAPSLKIFFNSRPADNLTPVLTDSPNLKP